MHIGASFVGLTLLRQDFPVGATGIASKHISDAALYMSRSTVLATHPIVWILAGLIDNQAMFKQKLVESVRRST